MLYDKEIGMWDHGEVLLGPSECSSRGGEDGAYLSHLATGDSGSRFWSNICVLI